MSGKKIREVSLVDRLVDAIRDDIVAGEHDAGSHIVIRKVADMYGVSMIPVREALARLLSSRLVRVEANRGYFVAARPTPAEFRQFVQAREMFETSAVALGFDNVTPEDIDQLRELNDRMRVLSASERESTFVEWGKLNAGFHQTLVGLARNEYLNYHYANLSFGNLHYQLVRSYPQDFTSLKILVEQHDEMIDALEQRDKDRLRVELSNHVRNITLEE